MENGIEQGKFDGRCTHQLWNYTVSHFIKKIK